MNLKDREKADVVIRRVVGAVAALACVALLSSCSYVSAAADQGQTKRYADAQMRHIAEAVKTHDAAALKKLFSPNARAKATDLDSGLEYFLSVFPSGKMTWKIDPDGPGGTDLVTSQKAVLETLAYYNVKANGKEYELFFADVTTDNVHPHNLGIFALGVAQDDSQGAAEYSASGVPTPYYNWIDTFGIDNLGDLHGGPGVYVPHK